MASDGPAPPGGQPLLEAILDEQEARWNGGERPSPEELLAQHPTLRADADADAAVDVIYHDFVIRLARGESPSPADYLRRFPTLADALMRQFAVDEALRPVAGSTRNESDLAAITTNLLSTNGGMTAPGARHWIEGYEILGELGRGGMGIVFKALERRLNRLVAIKTISETAFTAPSQLRRFLAEAEVIARLKHPNIIPIYAVGEENGRPYFSLELAEGGSLAERLAKGPVATREAAELVETLARAVSAAHAAGIIHRDLKPSNVLLAADGAPKIGDFGLAKLLGDDSARTISGEVLGTPSYMAPEQAEGNSREVGPAADIYALGAILYQALTGRPPFLGASAIETMKLVISTEAVQPRRHRPEIPRDLETITLKCLEKDRRGRYPDASALADDLHRFLECRPIAARPVGPLGRSWRWRRRNPALAATAAALLLTFGFGSPVLLGLWLQARADRARAEVERTQAEVERDRAGRSRDRAVRAVDTLLRTEDEALSAEELRPYRTALIAAGLRESLALVHDLEQDARAEYQRLEAYHALARVQAEGQDESGAIETSRKAIALAEKLVARDPAAIRPRIALAGSLHRASVIFRDEPSRHAAALRSNEILHSIPPDSAALVPAESAILVPINNYNLGHDYWTRGLYSEAIAEFLAAQAAYDHLLEASDQSLRTRDLAGRNLLYLCRAYGINQIAIALEAGHRAESIFRTLVRECPDRFDFAWQLYLVEEELGRHYLAAERWQEAIVAFEQSCRTLKEMAGRHSKLVSRMASIQSRLAMADFNLIEAYASAPVKYAAARRALTTEAYEICDKLSIVQPLEWNCRIVYATMAFAMADHQAEDGQRVDIELIKRAERLWEDLRRESRNDSVGEGELVVIRRRLAEELADRGQRGDAAWYERHAMDTARGQPELLYLLAIDYARDAALTGKLPARLSVDQLQKRRQRFAASAIALLRQAADDGFKEAARLKKEPMFDPFRSDPDFRVIVADIEFPAQPFAAR